MGILRVEPARNNQRRFVRLARNYEIGRVEIKTTKVDDCDRLSG
jgi:hypothetical protein